MDERAAQRQRLRDVFDAQRWMARAGAPWRLPPGDFAPWQGGIPTDTPLVAGRLF